MFRGKTPDDAQGEKLGEWCRTAEVLNERPVYCKETRPSVQMWWSSGRWSRELDIGAVVENRIGIVLGVNFERVVTDVARA